MISFAGLDYSISSPAACVITGSDVRFYFFSKTPMEVGMACANGHYMFKSMKAAKSYENQQIRYAEKAEWISSAVPENSITGIEDYAFGAKGRTFNIGECTELLKWFLWDRKKLIPEQFSPSEIKKFATGKGNANKDLMADAFFAKNGFWVHELLGCENRSDSPASDCVDAYFIARMMQAQAK